MDRIGFHIPLINSSFLDSVKYHFENGMGVRDFQIFPKNPRQMKVSNINIQDANNVKKYIQDNDISLVTHASYLLNMSNPDNWDTKIQLGENELFIANQIGAIGTVFHVGKHLKLTVQQGEDLMFNYISHMVNFIKSNNLTIKYIIETSAACGTELLYRIEDLGRFYRRFSQEDREYIKICIDTCHIFSAGIPIHTDEGCLQTIQLIENEIGWTNILVIHLNDSLSLKGCGCKLDRHANIMTGFIKDGMKKFVEHTTSLNISHILETPYEDGKIFETHMNEINEIHQWFEEN